MTRHTTTGHATTGPVRRTIRTPHHATPPRPHHATAPQPHRTPIAAVLLAGLIAPAFAAPAPAAGGPRGFSARFEIEHFADGVDPVQTGYAALLKACRDAGIATSPLPEPDVQRLGRNELVMAYDGTHQFLRLTEFRFRVGPGETMVDRCRFSPLTTYHESYADERVTGATDHDGDRPFWNPGDHEPGPVHRARDADGLRSDLDDSRRAGWSGPTADSVAGQPCQRWTRQTPRKVSVCLLSGHADFGLSDTLATEVDAASPYDLFLSHVVLEQNIDPATAPGGVATRVRTVSFSRGAPAAGSYRLITPGAP